MDDDILLFCQWCCSNMALLTCGDLLKWCASNWFALQTFWKGLLLVQRLSLLVHIISPCPSTREPSEYLLVPVAPARLYESLKPYPSLTGQLRAPNFLRIGVICLWWAQRDSITTGHFVYFPGRFSKWKKTRPKHIFGQLTDDLCKEASSSSSSSPSSLPSSSSSSFLLGVGKGNVHVDNVRNPVLLSSLFGTPEGKSSYFKGGEIKCISGQK